MLGVPVESGVPDGLVTVVYGRLQKPRLLISQWRGNTEVHFRKVISGAAIVDVVRVNGGPGIWITGAPHLLFFRDASGGLGNTPVYLVGKVLLWMQGDLSYRLEAEIPLDEALRIARSMR